MNWPPKTKLPNCSFGATAAAAVIFAIFKPSMGARASQLQRGVAAAVSREQSSKSTLCFHRVAHGSLCGLPYGVIVVVVVEASGVSHFTAKSSGKQTWTRSLPAPLLKVEPDRRLRELPSGGGWAVAERP